MRPSAIVVAVLSLLLGRTSTATDTKSESRDALLVASLERWAQGGNERAAGLVYVELPAVSRAPRWRFLRIAAEGDNVGLIGAASHSARATGCRIRRLLLRESRKGVAAILAASARALTLPQSASALERTSTQRRALVFTDGCREMSRTFADPRSARLRALFGQLGTLTDRVFKEGAAVADNPPAGKPIGDATMQRDGQLVFDLVAESPQGDHGLAQFTYSLTDKDYARMLVHLGGICPGRAGRIVPPWPDCGR